VRSRLRGALQWTPLLTV